MDDIIDYARPTLLAEKALKDMHNAVIEKRYADAKENALEALTQLRLAYQAICEEQKNVRKASTGA
jgi:hypothetical protein